MRLTTDNGFGPEAGEGRLAGRDCNFREFDELLARADIIEERQLPSGELKELLLLIDWRLPLHLVVVGGLQVRLGVGVVR